MKSRHRRRTLRTSLSVATLAVLALSIITACFTDYRQEVNEVARELSLVVTGERKERSHTRTCRSMLEMENPHQEIHDVYESARYRILVGDPRDVRKEMRTLRDHMQAEGYEPTELRKVDRIGADKFRFRARGHKHVTVEVYGNAADLPGWDIHPHVQITVLAKECHRGSRR